MARPSPPIAFLLCLPVIAAVALACAGSGGGAGKEKKKRTVLLTEYDDQRVGEESSKEVAAQMGLLEDPKLSAYIDGIGHRLLRGVPRQGFDYQFSVVDMVEPNAFALPGGYIFVSRGLLALANDEDELACVIGHEITHAAHRHAAAQQGLARRGNPLAMPWNRAARMAGYSREMERDADEGGQKLCAAAGYDPMGMSRFLTQLKNVERLQRGTSREPGFYDTHPGSTERAATNAVRAKELRWQRSPEIGDPRTSFLARVDGLPIGQRPEAGIFQGNVFLHPDLDFQMRFPEGWKTVNSARAVGATSPRGDAVVFLSTDAPEGDLEAAAQAWLDDQKEKGARLNVTKATRLKVGKLDAVRIHLESSALGGGVAGVVTFIPYGESNWRITGAARKVEAGQFLGRTLNTTRSFRPLTPEERASITVTRLRVVKARKGESLEALGERTGSQWPPTVAAVYNGVFEDHRFREGEMVKIAEAEAYRAKQPSQPRLGP